MAIIFILFSLAVLTLIFSTAYALWYYFRSKTEPVLIFPKDFGLKSENISIPLGENGIISGWFIKKSSSNKTVVLAHGFAMNKGDILKRTAFLAEEYNLFYFDFLGAGESIGHTQVGYSEPLAIEAVIDYLKKNKAEASSKIALYGLSQGAGAGARYAAEHKTISCLILEAVYFSFREIAGRWMWKRCKTPYFPAVWGYLFLKERKIKQSLDFFAPKTTAAKINIPALVLHGGKDTVSPAANAEKVYALLNGRKKIWISPEAGHTSCAKYSPEEYKAEIKNFLKEYL